jgi:hypothetical protein
VVRGMLILAITLCIIYFCGGVIACLKKHFPVQVKSELGISSRAIPRRQSNGE